MLKRKSHCMNSALNILQTFSCALDSFLEIASCLFLPHLSNLTVRNEFTELLCKCTNSRNSSLNHPVHYKIPNKRGPSYPSIYRPIDYSVLGIYLKKRCKDKNASQIYLSFSSSQLWFLSKNKSVFSCQSCLHFVNQCTCITFTDGPFVIP